VLHCITGQPDVISRLLPGESIIFHSYADPLESVPPGMILIIHEPRETWLLSRSMPSSGYPRILLAENPRAIDIKHAVNDFGVIKISDLEGLPGALREVFRQVALLRAQARMEGTSL